MQTFVSMHRSRTASATRPTPISRNGPPSAHAEDRLEDLSALGFFTGLVDLVEVVEFHQTVEGEAPLHVQLQKLRDENVRDRIALDDAPDGPPEQDGVHVEARLGAQGRRPDQT